VAWSAWGAVARHASRAYIAGPELRDALRTCHELAPLGYSLSLCFWDTEADESRQVADAYLAALSAIAAEKLDCYLSVKLAPLRRGGDRVPELLARARGLGTLVHFDSLGPEAADETLAVIADAARSGAPVGCTLPGRWRRSCRDAQLASDLGLHVRVVKGQWPDPAEPGLDPRRGFLDVVDHLAGRARTVAVATHDAALCREALGRLRRAGTACALELLYGLPVRRAVQVARELGVPVRIYVPYGHGWLPYSLSQARKNPWIVWWVLRDALTRGSAFPPLGER
jgi:proline dehydrogenase